MVHEVAMTSLLMYHREQVHVMVVVVVVPVVHATDDEIAHYFVVFDLRHLVALGFDHSSHSKNRVFDEDPPILDVSLSKLVESTQYLFHGYRQLE